MKSFGSFSRLAVYALTAAALSCAAYVQAAAGRAIVRGVSGTAEYAVSEGADFQALSADDVLSPGAVVRTGAGSQVDLFLGINGPTVRLVEGTTLKLARLDSSRSGIESIIDTQLDLRTGTIQGQVYKMATASKYEVKTPNTVFGIRGTEGPSEYQISADGTHHILEGLGVVAYTNPRTQTISTHTVNEGQTFMPPTDPAQPNVVPQVVATTPGAPRPPLPPPPPPAEPAPIVVVPEPVQFVSPGTGSSR